MKERLKKLQKSFIRHRVDAVLVTNPTDIRYLTGFLSSDSWLLVTAKKSVYITDARYTLEARAGLKGIAVREYRKSFFQTVFELARSSKVKRLGLDERYLTVFQYKKLKKHCPAGTRLVSADQLIARLRMIKDPKEIRQIKKAISINSQAFTFLKKIIKPGIKESDVLVKLARFIKAQGVGFSFDPIIASGVNSCFPHAKISGRKIRNNEPVLVDMGVDVQGYKSDLTRMFFLGKIPHSVEETSAIVAAAQRKAIEKVKAGVQAAEVDQEARNYLTKKRLGKYFSHSLGHGVGLDIHEAPAIAKGSSTLLEENMIFTVEPAVYFPKKFGIRIEDMVLVTKHGCKVLSDDND